MRAASSAKCSGDRWAYRRTDWIDFHPPSSISARSDVPAMTCQEAQVCLRSCHRSGAMRARLWAAIKPLLLALLYGFPSSLGKTQRACAPT